MKNALDNGIRKLKIPDTSSFINNWFVFKYVNLNNYLFPHSTIEVLTKVLRLSEWALDPYWGPQWELA